MAAATGAADDLAPLLDALLAKLSKPSLPDADSFRSATAALSAAAGRPVLPDDGTQLPPKVQAQLCRCVGGWARGWYEVAATRWGGVCRH